MINVVGLGYIGLPTALMFAAHGVEVVGTDYNKGLVDTLQSGKPTFEEDGLDELFNEAVKKGIRFSHEYQSKWHVQRRRNHISQIHVYRIWRLRHSKQKLCCAPRKKKM